MQVADIVIEAEKTLYPRSPPGRLVGCVSGWAAWYGARVWGPEKGAFFRVRVWCISAVRARRALQLRLFVRPPFSSSPVASDALDCVKCRCSVWSKWAGWHGRIFLMGYGWLARGGRGDLSIIIDSDIRLYISLRAKTRPLFQRASPRRHNRSSYISSIPLT